MWNSMRNELNELHQRLEEKPDSEKMGYACCPGGILNAYREADITFQQAVKAIEEWALSQGAKNTEQQVQPDNSPKMCEECGEYPADLPSKLCCGCDAYKEHLS